MVPGYRACRIGWTGDTQGEETFGYVPCNRIVEPGAATNWMRGSSEANAACAKLHPNGVPSPEVILNPDNTLRNALVYVKSGAGVLNEPGALAWTELYSRNASAARDFFASVFGYL